MKELLWKITYLFIYLFLFYFIFLESPSFITETPMQSHGKVDTHF